MTGPVSEYIVTDPELVWRNEASLRDAPLSDPPPWEPGTWKITRSEVSVGPRKTVVSIWYTAIPAQRAEGAGS